MVTAKVGVCHGTVPLEWTLLQMPWCILHVSAGRADQVFSYNSTFTINGIKTKTHLFLLLKKIRIFSHYSIFFLNLAKFSYVA